MVSYSPNTEGFLPIIASLMVILCLFPLAVAENNEEISSYRISTVNPDSITGYQNTTYYGSAAVELREFMDYYLGNNDGLVQEGEVTNMENLIQNMEYNYSINSISGETSSICSIQGAIGPISQENAIDIYLQYDVTFLGVDETDYNFLLVLNNNNSNHVEYIFPGYAITNASGISDISLSSNSISGNRIPATLMQITFEIDTDLDGIGDNSDLDDDNDGWSDIDEANCNTNPLNEMSTPSDFDLDTICDGIDLDDDNDGFDDDIDWSPLDSTEWNDNDGDRIGDNADLDDDNDGWDDQEELNCGTDKFDPESYPFDNDNDKYCDSMDPDDDNDGFIDMDDAFPLDSNEWEDGDGDLIGDNADPDDDNDNFPDAIDLFPNDPSEWFDNDLDGFGNNADLDDDNDLLLDENEELIGTNPFNSDTDSDGFDDYNDEFPLNSKEWRDTDNDGVGDFSDILPTISRYGSVTDLGIDFIAICTLLFVGFTFAKFNRE